MNKYILQDLIKYYVDMFIDTVYTINLNTTCTVLT